MCFDVVDAIDLPEATCAEPCLEFVDLALVVGLDLEAPCRVDGLAAWRQVDPGPGLVVSQVSDLLVDGLLPLLLGLLDSLGVGLGSWNVRP